MTSTAPGDVNASARVGMRRATFLYQDGVVLCSTVRALDELGLIESSLGAERSVAELLPETTGGWGYLRVGLRTLASEGWLASPPTMKPESTVLRWTDAGRAVAAHRQPYRILGDFLADFRSPAADAWCQRWSEARTRSFGVLARLAATGWPLKAVENPLRAHMRMHLDGALAIPLMLALRGSGALRDDGPTIAAGTMGHIVTPFLQLLGFIDTDGSWTDRGRLAAEFSAYWGIVGSYLPLLAELPSLYRGTSGIEGVPSAPGEAAPKGLEWHVNRPLNVAASAAAHRRYFGDAEAVILDVFSREPAGSRPRFVADVGCGDGSWLIHIDRLLQQEAGPRPLMVGIDCNELALREARVQLGRAGVDALLLRGDVSDPDAVARSLAEHGLDMRDGLHIRAFVDHDRRYRGAHSQPVVPAWASGAYVDSEGCALASADVERDLVDHLRRWAPYAARHGLVVLEAHSVAPKIARNHLGALHSVAFDAYHGYAHQYPVEYAAFDRCLRQAGLAKASYCERQYPSSRPFAAISLNRLLGTPISGVLPAMQVGVVRVDTWRPDPGVDMTDGRAMHELLYADGDLRHPRPWCAPATGWVVAGALKEIEKRLATANPGDVIRLLDYGTGSGLAAIEFLKACRQRGIDELLELRGVKMEFHLVDLPSSWFAQGYEILRDCAWTRFHSLVDDQGKFRPLLEVTGGHRVDVVLANMVFHLIPLRALSAVAEQLEKVLAPDGSVMWSSPDLGPRGDYAILFHDVNRAVRARWLELLTECSGGADRRDRSAAPSEPLQAALRTAAALSNDELRSARVRAERRVLSQPHTSEEVVHALGDHLVGDIELHTYEMLDEEFLDALLVPSNQGEYLAEIVDPSLRQAMIRTLMCAQVLPALRETSAGTDLGLGVQWTLGRFARRERI